MRRTALAVLACFLATCSQPAPLEVKDPWTRDTVGGVKNAAVFMTITSATDDRLVSAATPAARRTDLMTMAGSGGVMQMDYLRGIDIPADEAVSLNPSGLHIWLAGLRKPLKTGEAFPLTLTFEKAGQRRVLVTVLAPTAAAPGSAD